MNTAVLITITTIIFLLLSVFLFKKNIKYLLVCAFVFAIVATVFVCVKRPVMHKPFSLNVVDYLIKFNNDGSVTTTKQTTTTVIKEENK